MPCYRPMKAYRAPGGGIVWNQAKGISPVTLACGQCHGCRMSHARMWAIRCMHEAQMHEENSFVTLTYSPELLPTDWSLDVRDFQLFIKRLRKTGRKVRYFQCGEYGELGRPHHHALLFGEDFSCDRIRHKRSPSGHWLYRSPLLERTWQKGHAWIGDVTYESAEYVSRYVMKKVTGFMAEDGHVPVDLYDRVDQDTGEVFQVRPEFITMSRRPGIGAEWYRKFGKEDVESMDEVVLNGRRFRPPRFYDEKRSEEELREVKEKRFKAALRHRSDLTADRLKAREQIALRKQMVVRRKL